MSYSFRLDMPRLLSAMDAAPSIFNQRVWELRFAGDDRVELYSVPDEPLGRMLPREVVISCGTALYNLRLAIQAAGRQLSVWPLPDLDLSSGLLTRVTAEPTLIASVEVMAGRLSPATVAEQELYEALWLRRTDRWPYRELPVPLPILVEMQEGAAHERGWLRILSRRQRRQVLRAVGRANKDPLLDMLSGLNRVPSADYGPFPEGKRVPVTRPGFWLSERSARFESLRHVQLMALCTDDDRPLDWLRAGEALQHALLNGTRFSMSALGGRSTRYGQQPMYGPLDPHRLHSRRPVPAGYAVEASFLTQFLELADLKAQLAELKAPDRVDLSALAPADLEALELADRKDRQRRRDGGLRWPWRTNYAEIPQVVMRVGYAPAERVSGPGDPYATQTPAHPDGEPRTVSFPRPANN